MRPHSSRLSPYPRTVRVLSALILGATSAALAPAASAQEEPIPVSPEDGAVVTDPPTFRWRLQDVPYPMCEVAIRDRAPCEATPPYVYRHTEQRCDRANPEHTVPANRWRGIPACRELHWCIWGYDAQRLPHVGAGRRITRCSSCPDWGDVTAGLGEDAAHVTVRWSDDAGLGSYCVTRREAGGGAFAEIGCTEQTRYDDRGTAAGRCPS